jgi:tRNA (mo5U34)-methyltransferase
VLDQALAIQLVHGRPWHHDFEIVPGVRTNGTYNPSTLWSELQLPSDLSGMRVADVGASNGFFSFEARKRGAQVVAFDFRHKDNSGFGLAQYINGMFDIEHYHVNVLDLTPDRFGQFDVVLALGLLYHVSDPYRALANCAALAAKRLLIESYCIDATMPDGLNDEPVMKFISDPVRFPRQGQPNDDPSNFWGFTSTCLRRMVEDIGFNVTRINCQHHRLFADCERAPLTDAKTRLAMAYSICRRIPVGQNPDDPRAWTVF